MEKSVTNEQFDMAKQLAATATAIARKSKDLAFIKETGVRIRAIAKEMADVQEAQTRVVGAVEILDKTPTDPAANLAVGRYRCFTKNQWNQGLPLLALGSDAALKDLAIAELKEVSDAAEQAKLGDAWWDLAQQEQEMVKQRLQRRAAYWYERALPELAGLAKDKAEKRMHLLNSSQSDENAASALPSSAYVAAAPAPRPNEPPSSKAKKQDKAKDVPGKWLVLLRSTDPRAWNRDVNRGAIDYAISLDKVPGDIRFLRLSCVVKKNAVPCVILPMSRERLTQCSENEDRVFGWNGTAAEEGPACDLGIYNNQWKINQDGVVHVRTRNDCAGWGFGFLRLNVNRRVTTARAHGGLSEHVVHENPEGQGYSWAGKTLPGPVVFEIAVTALDLSDAESKRLLKK